MTKLPVEHRQPDKLHNKSTDDSEVTSSDQQADTLARTEENESLDSKLARLFIAMANSSLRDKQDNS